MIKIKVTAARNKKFTGKTFNLTEIEAGLYSTTINKKTYITRRDTEIEDGSGIALHLKGSDCSILHFEEIELV